MSTDENGPDGQPEAKPEAPFLAEPAVGAGSAVEAKMAGDEEPWRPRDESDGSAKGSRSKKMGLVALAVLTGLTGVLAIGVLGRSMFDRFSHHEGLPKIMVLSKSLVLEGVNANSEQMDEKTKLVAIMNENPQLQKLVGGEGKGGDGKGGKGGDGKGAEGKGGGQVAPDPAKELDARGDRKAQLKLLAAAMEDGLAIEINQQLQATRRFLTIPVGQVATQMAQMLPKAEPTQASATPAVGVTQDKHDKAEAAREQKSRTYDASVEQIASNLKADYTMTVALALPDDPDFRILLPDRANPVTRAELSIQPTIYLEVYSADSRRNFRADLRYRLPAPIKRTFNITQPLIRTNFEADLSDASGALLDDLHRRVGKLVVNWLISQIGEARVIAVDGGQFAIDRGSNDGVRVGAVYDVMRESGEEMTSQSVDGAVASLGKKMDKVGSVTIRSVDAVKSFATTVSGGPFQKGDVVVMGTAAGGDGTTAAAAGDAPLGATELAQTGVAGRGKVRLAVDDIRVSVGGRSGFSNELSRAIAFALARDPRVSVIPRSQMDQVQAERSLNAAGNGEEAAGPLATSNFLITGEFAATTHSRSSSISVAGYSEKTGTTTWSSVSGTLHVTSSSGVAKASTTANGGSLQSVAEDAARKLLVQLFPMRVVQASGATVVLDRGQDAAMRPGMRVTLYRVGAPIPDPVTGAVHEGVRTQIGEAVVTAVQETISTAALDGGVLAQAGDIAQTGALAAVSSGAAGSAAGPSRGPVRHAAPKPAKAKAKAGGEEGMHF